MVLSVNKQGWLNEASGGGADESQSPVVHITTKDHSRVRSQTDSKKKTAMKPLQCGMRGKHLSRNWGEKSDQPPGAALP